PTPLAAGPTSVLRFSPPASSSRTERAAMNFSRRGFIKGALAAAGAAAGSRIGGPFVRSALADTGEPSHLVHIYFNGGLNAYFAGQARLFAGKAFGVVDNTTTIKDIGNGLTTDAATFGTLPQYAFD